jgi:hypothetical protein
MNIRCICGNVIRPKGSVASCICGRTYRRFFKGKPDPFDFGAFLFGVFVGWFLTWAPTREMTISAIAAGAGVGREKVEEWAKGKKK